MVRMRAGSRGLLPLLKLDDVKLRRKPVELRKATLKGLLRCPHRGILEDRH